MCGVATLRHPFATACQGDRWASAGGCPHCPVPACSKLQVVLAAQRSDGEARCKRWAGACGGHQSCHSESCAVARGVVTQWWGHWGVGCEALFRRGVGRIADRVACGAVSDAWWRCGGVGGGLECVPGSWQGGAGWLVCGEKRWKSACLWVWCGAEGAVVGADTM